MSGKHFLKIVTSRDTYGVRDAIEHTMSVREYINLLEYNCADLDMPIVFWNDNGYTLGYIRDNSVSEGFLADDEEE